MAQLNRVFVKDPNEVKDYVFDWNGSTPGPGIPSGDSVSTYTLTAETGITIDSDSEYEADAIQLFVSGGTAGNDYTITCRVVTAQGRTLEASILVKVRDTADT